MFPNRMFQQNDYQFFELAQKEMTQYTIQPGDELTVRVYSRDGFKLVDVLGGRTISVTDDNGGESMTSGNQTQSRIRTNEEYYVVDQQGFANLPVLGFFYVKGYTEVELERILSEKYASMVVDPYVIVTVTNRRVFVFKGEYSQVVQLNPYPTNLLEVLAKSGGLSKNFKSYNIKVIRGDLKNPEVQLVDLSTLEGMRRASLNMLPNDVVYIDERRRVAAETLRDVAPIITILSSTASLIYLTQRLAK